MGKGKFSSSHLGLQTQAEVAELLAIEIEALLVLARQTKKSRLVAVLECALDEALKISRGKPTKQ
jgi:hypothetical protein